MSLTQVTHCPSSTIPNASGNTPAQMPPLNTPLNFDVTKCLSENPTCKILNAPFQMSLAQKPQNKCSAKCLQSKMSQQCSALSQKYLCHCVLWQEDLSQNAPEKIVPAPKGPTSTAGNILRSPIPPPHTPFPYHQIPQLTCNYPPLPWLKYSCLKVSGRNAPASMSQKLQAKCPFSDVPGPNTPSLKFWSKWHNQNISIQLSLIQMPQHKLTISKCPWL